MGDPLLLFKMPSFRPVVQVLVLAAVAPWLYDRYVALSPILTNTPARFESLRTFDSYEVKYKDRLKNCEDVILEKSLGIAFLSCDPGRDRWNTVMGTFKPVKNGEDHGGLYIYDYSIPNVPDKDRLKHLQVDEADLHPLGIAYDASTSTLYAINHSRHKGSHILILHVDTKTHATTLVARFTHPLLHAPNSIQVLGPHELYVTNDHYITASKASILSKIETFSGAPGGSVVYVNVRFPKSAKVVARVPFANGITSLNETTLAIASSSKSGLYLFDREENHELALNQIIRTPAAVDNLSTDGQGGVLMAGHPFAPALMKTSKGRWKCDENGSQEEREACQCTAPSWVAEWSEEGGLREVYKDNGSEFCSSSTIVRDNSRDVGIISGLYESGILVFKP